MLLFITSFHNLFRSNLPVICDFFEFACLLPVHTGSIGAACQPAVECTSSCPYADIWCSWLTWVGITVYLCVDVHEGVCAVVVAAFRSFTLALHLKLIRKSHQPALSPNRMVWAQSGLVWRSFFVRLVGWFCKTQQDVVCPALLATTSNT